MSLLNFRQFILEEPQAPSEGQKLKHLRHLEDNAIYDGHEGVALADQHLNSVHNALLGKKGDVHISTKWDGAPSIVYGVHPTTKQFFVATKGAFNKTPKINYTEEDIDANHGHAPGLAEKLKVALRELPKIMPKNGGVYQGDVLHTPEDIQSKNGRYNFTPNTITYSQDTNSPEGKKIKNSSLGIVTHTKYTGKGDLTSMSASPLDDKTREQFKDHPDVHHVDPRIDINPSNYTPEEQKEFLNHMENARIAYSKMKPEAPDALAGHGAAMEQHVNQMVRAGGLPSTEGYANMLTDQTNKKIEALKTEKGKEKYIQQHAALMKHISDNRDHFDKAFQLHGHLQGAKNVLTRIMAKNNPYGHSIAGEATDPEGAVVVDKAGNMSKFVNRGEFARQNLLAGKFRQQQAQQAQENA
jgi:hypothetical protein